MRHINFPIAIDRFRVKQSSYTRHEENVVNISYAYLEQLDKLLFNEDGTIRPLRIWQFKRLAKFKKLVIGFVVAIQEHSGGINPSNEYDKGRVAQLIKIIRKYWIKYAEVFAGRTMRFKDYLKLFELTCEMIQEINSTFPLTPA